MGLGVASPAGAQTYVNQPVPVVGSSDAGRSPVATSGSPDAGRSGPVLAQTARQAPVVAAPQPGGRLAFTGADIGGLIFIGLALAGTGSAVVRVARRPPTPSPTA
jgi:hypothetical protein